MNDDKKLKEFRVIETATIIREGYIEAESLEEAEAIVDSDDYFDIDMEITEEYTDNIEVWEDWQVFKRTENNLKSSWHLIRFVIGYVLWSLRRRG